MLCVCSCGCVRWSAAGTARLTVLSFRTKLWAAVRSSTAVKYAALAQKSLTEEACRCFPMALCTAAILLMGSMKVQGGSAKHRVTFTMASGEMVNPMAMEWKLS